MEIRIDHLSFSLPPGLKDLTDYTFSDPNSFEQLIVAEGKPPAEATNSADVLADRRDNLKLVMGDKIKIEPESAGTIAGLPARQFSFSGEEKGKPFRVYWSAIWVNPSKYILIAYTTSAEDPKAASRFAHITQSSRFSDAVPPPSEVRTGYRRRFAAGLVLDVPTPLNPPAVYQFTSPDEKIKISLIVNDFSQPGRTFPSPEDRINQQVAQGGKISDKKSASLTSDQGMGQMISCITTGGSTGTNSIALREGTLTFPNPLQISFSGQCPQGKEQELDRILSNITGSITLK